MSERVHITEVGPRDGLQNESVALPTEAKVGLVEALVAAGLRQIEVGSFVHPQRVPAMADAERIHETLHRVPGVRYLALVPNERGYERALAAGCDAIALFTAASGAFVEANIGMGVDESLDHFRGLARRAADDGVAVRGYVSTIFECPYAGRVELGQVVRIVEAMVAMGCYEVSLGDTIGTGTPADVRRLLRALLSRVDGDRLVLHFHDTWGMGAANALAGLDLGIRRFDGSAGGLGGCPYAPGATGNAGTEDLVYLFEGLGFETGIDPDAVARAADGIAGYLDHPLVGRVHQALLARQRRRIATEEDA